MTLPLTLLRLALLFTVLLSACGTPRLAPPPPDAPQAGFTGLWRGEARDNFGRGVLELSLVQSGEDITGDALLTLSVGLLRHSAAGTVTGRAEGDRLFLRLTPDDPLYCSYVAVAERVGDRLQGSYAGEHCRGEIAGSVTLGRQ
jgi:hypothetical protein